MRNEFIELTWYVATCFSFAALKNVSWSLDGLVTRYLVLACQRSLQLKSFEVLKFGCPFLPSN
jgi:hypothetical protein